MRSLVPYLVLTDKNNTSDVCAEFMKKIFVDADDFIRKNNSVAGIFVWVKHIGRHNNVIIDCLNQDEVILINAKSLFDDIAKSLFPTAALPKDLNWYCERGLFLP
jgi:hypothetical protein